MNEGNIFINNCVWNSLKTEAICLTEEDTLNLWLFQSKLKNVLTKLYCQRFHFILGNKFSLRCFASSVGFSKLWNFPLCFCFCFLSFFRNNLPRAQHNLVPRCQTLLTLLNRLYFREWQKVAAKIWCIVGKLNFLADGLQENAAQCGTANLGH